MLTRKTKVPKKLYKTKLHRVLGVVSPSLFFHYLRQGDPEVVKFAIETGYFEHRAREKSNAHTKD